MAISEKMIDQAYSDLKEKCGGVRNDYYGLLYLEKEFEISQDEAINYVAFGGNDYGIDGFYFDRESRNFYIFQFKWSDSHTLFKESFQRLISAGMERVFGAKSQDPIQNNMLLQLGACLRENQELIKKVYIHFVFKGDPEDAERSSVLDKLREDLENKKHLMDDYFEGRSVSLTIEFRSSQTRKVGAVNHQRKTRSYIVELSENLNGKGSNNENMFIAFVKISDLHKMYQDMGVRFFERNIRSGLSESGSVNRALDRAFKQIIIDKNAVPVDFTFNHNGVTVFAEKFEKEDGVYKITEPRLLNGAQTITTFDRFLEKNTENPKLKENKYLLDQIRVIGKIITNASDDFVTTVTINNNRQNPVEPWNLRANDMIQLELQEKFKDDLSIFYERQEKSFENMSDEDLEDSGITEKKSVNIKTLAQTFLVSDGEIVNTSWMSRVFEDDRIYGSVFNEGRLKADSRKILLCYKIQYRLRKLANDIYEKGPNKYGFMNKARPLLWALICQGILNDPKIEEVSENFGRDMTISADFTDYLSNIANNKCRHLLSELASQKENKEKIDEGKFSFLRTNNSYNDCMEFAHKRWKWVTKRLK